jgi:catechol 2,3-dioxygenase-like lactoylglutathione lyase family enzyme
MIDHISLAVRDLVIAERFYTAVLAPLGLSKVRDLPDAAIGYGKNYPEFWINKREAMGRVADDSGVHICLRALPSPAASTLPPLIASADEIGVPGIGRTVPPCRMRSALSSAGKAGPVPTPASAEAAPTE